MPKGAPHPGYGGARQDARYSWAAGFGAFAPSLLFDEQEKQHDFKNFNRQHLGIVKKIFWYSQFFGHFAGKFFLDHCVGRPEEV